MDINELKEKIEEMPKRSRGVCKGTIFKRFNIFIQGW